jgi:hypothetical protein
MMKNQKRPKSRIHGRIDIRIIVSWLSPACTEKLGSGERATGLTSTSFLRSSRIVASRVLFSLWPSMSGART